MRLFECYIRGSGDSWEAICVDFDISVTGTSLLETKSRLEEAVAEYVAHAFSKEDKVRDRLLKRRSPLHVRLGLRLQVAYFALLASRNNPEFEGRFALPCPA